MKTKPLILAADDDRTTLMILTAQLEQFGYETVQATNGHEALEIALENPSEIDAIILDRMMPEMNGLEVIAKLKDNEATRHIPIIIATGSNKPEEIQESMDAGAFHHLKKPYEDELLKSVLKDALKG